MQLAFWSVPVSVDVTGTPDQKQRYEKLRKQ